jgi:ferritin-like metal-binding protein YciE
MEIRDLLIEEMRDLYDAEKQLVKALPKMAKAASNSGLSQAFAHHLEETKGHVQRLEQAFQMLGVRARGKPCAAMKGLIAEAQETMAGNMPDELMDAAMICAAQKVEHYEISGYGTICAWTDSLGLNDVSDLLQDTLDEEKAADEKLTEVCEPIVLQAVVNATVHEEESAKPGTRKAAGGKAQTAGYGRRSA